MSSNPEIGSLNRTRAIMKEYGIHAKKGFGQNFLTDLNVLKNIVKAAAITKEDNVIEIGPGLGALTEQLAQAAIFFLIHFYKEDSQILCYNVTSAPRNLHYKILLHL